MLFKDLFFSPGYYLQILLKGELHNILSYTSLHKLFTNELNVFYLGRIYNLFLFI